MSIYELKLPFYKRKKNCVHMIYVFILNSYFVKSIQAPKLGEAGWTGGGGVMKWAVNNDKYGVQSTTVLHTPPLTGY